MSRFTRRPPVRPSPVHLILGATLAASCHLAVLHDCQSQQDCVSGQCVDHSCREVADGPAGAPPADALPADAQTTDARSTDAGSADAIPPFETPLASACGPAWAAWPMPAPPSLTGSPDDPLRNLPNPQSYDTSSPDVVVDNLTHLVWQKAIGRTTLTFAEAQQSCADLELGGRTDWRLPSRIELISLVDFSGTRVGNVDDVAFPDAPAAAIWSCSTGPASPPFAWIVDFLHGSAGVVEKTARNLVRCVAGATTSTPAPTRYQSAAPNAVRDLETGLVWTITPAPGLVTWGQAYEFCRALGEGWRLPSLTELQTLIDETQAGAAVDRTTFDNPDDFYWTSSFFDHTDSMPWFVSIGEGNSWWTSSSDLHRARCVQ